MFSLKSWTSSNSVAVSSGTKGVKMSRKAQGLGFKKHNKASLFQNPPGGVDTGGHEGKVRELSSHVATPFMLHAWLRVTGKQMQMWRA